MGAGGIQWDQRSTGTFIRLNTIPSDFVLDHAVLSMHASANNFQMQTQSKMIWCAFLSKASKNAIRWYFAWLAKSLLDFTFNTGLIFIFIALMAGCIKTFYKSKFTLYHIIIRMLFVSCKWFCESSCSTLLQAHRLERVVKTGQVRNEFELIPRRQQDASFTSGTDPVNIQKNRYKDIIPYEVLYTVGFP